ncbi:MAG: tetratricopeptide repeat protein [Burkholderiales bacterium]
MKNVLVIATLSTLLSACAGLQTRLATAPPLAAGNASGKPAETATIATPPVIALEKKSALPPETDALPAVPLTPDIMFQQLAAEIAFQRGDWQFAYESTLSTAKRTHDPRLAQRAFEIAWTAKQPEKALVASRLWRTFAPHSEEATQNYLNSLVLSDKLDEAQVVFEKGLKSATPQTRGILMFQMQHLLARDANKEAAFIMLENLMAPYADTVEAHLALAYGAFAKGDNVRAQKEAQVALNIKPDSEQAALILAQVNPDKEAALKSLAKFVADHPNAQDLRVAYARILIEQKRYKEAEQEFETLLKGQPENLTVLYMLGILELQISDAKAAEQHLTAFLNVLANHPNEERDPTSAQLLLAQIAEDRKDNETALKWLDQVESPEAYVGVQIRRAGILAKEGHVSDARKLLSELTPVDPAQQVQVIATEAQILRDINQTQEAMAILEAGIKRFPDNTDLLYDYAMDAEKINQFDTCEAALRKIIKIAPKNQQAYNALGYTFAERNIRLDEAYALIDTALKLAPDDPFIIDSMGWVQFRLGRLKEAEALLRRAYSILQDPEIAVHLGEVLWTEGQKADADKLWRDAGAKDPDNDALKSTLSRLHVKL